MCLYTPESVHKLSSQCASLFFLRLHHVMPSNPSYSSVYSEPQLEQMCITLVLIDHLQKYKMVVNYVLVTRSHIHQARTGRPLTAHVKTAKNRVLPKGLSIFPLCYCATYTCKYDYFHLRGQVLEPALS